MGRRSRSGILYAVLVTCLGGCGPDEDVELLALPPLERPSPEARLGLPEVSGVWSFAGWEIVEGDSTSLDRTFPSFGELRFAAQRLDSIAGTFVLGGTPVPLVGDVRRDGRLTFVTLAGGVPQKFVAGTYVQDTLWLELSSVLASDEWPRNARAAFVRGAPSEPAFAWLRGARVVEVPPVLPVDSFSAGVPAGPDGFPQTTIQPGAPPAGSAGVGPRPGPTGQPGPARQEPAVQTPRPSGQQPAAQPTPSDRGLATPPAQTPQQPPAGQPSRPPVNQPGAQPPAQQPAGPQVPVGQPDNQPDVPPSQPAPPPVAQPAPGPAQPEPAPPAQPPEEGPGPLLGEPINP